MIYYTLDVCFCKHVFVLCVALGCNWIFGTFSSIAAINAAVNRHFGGVLGGVGNSSNTVVMYLFFYTGIIFSKG